MFLLDLRSIVKLAPEIGFGYVEVRWSCMQKETNRQSNCWGYRRAAEPACTCQGTSPLMLSDPPTTRVPVLIIGVIFVVAAVLVSVMLSSTSSWASSWSSVVMFQCSKVFMARVSLLFASGAVILPQGYGTGRETVTVTTGCVSCWELQQSKEQAMREMLPGRSIQFWDWHGRRRAVGQLVHSLCKQVFVPLSSQAGNNM